MRRQHPFALFVIGMLAALPSMRSSAMSSYVPVMGVIIEGDEPCFFVRPEDETVIRMKSLPAHPLLTEIYVGPGGMVQGSFNYEGSGAAQLSESPQSCIKYSQFFPDGSARLKPYVDYGLRFRTISEGKDWLSFRTSLCLAEDADRTIIDVGCRRTFEKLKAK
jgi:hypothetical protein